MTDLTPPPMSEDAIYELYESRDRFGMAWAAYCSGAEEAIAARDEQWRQRLEVAGYLVHGGRAFVDKAFTSQVGAELSASERKDGASVSPLYRIKEQG